MGDNTKQAQVAYRATDDLSVVPVTPGTPLPVTSNFAPALSAVTATIANGASLSGAAAVPVGKVVRGLQVPAAWTAALMTFDVSVDSGATYVSLRDTTGAEYAVSVAVSTLIPFPTVPGLTNIKVRSGLSGATVNQGASRDVLVLVG